MTSGNKRRINMKDWMFGKWMDMYKISWIFHCIAPVIVSDIFDTIVGIKNGGGLSWLIFFIILFISIILLNAKIYDDMFDKLFNDSDKDIIGDVKLKLRKYLEE